MSRDDKNDVEEVELTVDELDRKIEDKVEQGNKTLNEKIDKLVDATQALIDTNLNTSDKKTVTHEPLYDTFQDMKDKGYQFNKIGVREETDEWFEKLSPAQRGLEFFRALKRKDFKKIEKLHMFAPPEITKDYQPAYRPTRDEQLARFNNMYKDLTSGDASAGYLIPPDYEQMLIWQIYDPMNLMGNWTNIFTQTGDSTYMPLITTNSQAYWVSENSAKTESDPVFDQMRWTPNVQAVVTDVTNQVLEDSDPSIAQVLAEAHARALILDANYRFFYGSGAGEPRGINFDIAATEIVHAGPTFNPEDLKCLVYALRQDRRRGGWFYMNDVILSSIDRFVDTTGRFIWEISQDAHMVNLPPSTLIGYPVWSGIDDEIPVQANETGTGTGDCAHIFFGNPANYIAVIRRGIRLATSDSDGNNFKYNRTTFRTERRWDARMIPNTFSKLEGICDYNACT